MRHSGLTNLCFSLAVIILLLGTASPLLAVTYTWTGNASSDDWDEVDFGFPGLSNWSGGPFGTFPDSNDMAVFDTNSTGPINVQLNGTRQIISATFNGSSSVTLSDSQLRLSSGDLTVTGTSSNYNINSSVLLQSSAQWNIANAPARLTVAGPISGATSLTKTGSGRLRLTGNNTYSGTTNVTGGILEIGSGGTTGSIAGNLTNNATVTINRSNPYTFSDIISGNGTLNKQGAGSLTLLGNNSFSGTTVLSGGTLNIGNGGGSGSINSNIINNTSVTFNRSSSSTYSRVISGGGTVTKLGAGTLTLSGNNTHTGTTIVSAGTLQIGNGVTGSIAGNINNLSNVVFDRDNNLTYGGNVAGSGSVRKEGSGTLTLTGSHTYSGGTTINDGTLQVGNGGTTGSISGNIINDGILAFNRSNNVAFTNQIHGDGDLQKRGTGTLTLSAFSTYSGSTELHDGLVNFDLENSLGAPSAEVQALGGDLRYSGLLGVNTLRDFVLTNDLDFEISNPNVAYQAAGQISGTGRLTKSGPGTLVLRGDNVDGHNTTVAAGTLRITGEGTTGGNIENNATLDFDLVNAVSFGGVISGTGNLEKNGSVQLTLTGTNTYSGTTSINEGTVLIADDANLGDGGTVTLGDATALAVTGTTTATRDFLLSGATAFFNIDLSEAYTVNGDIGGTGQLIKAGDGTLALNGNNDYAGGTIVSAGVLALNDSASSGEGPLNIQGGQVSVTGNMSIGVAGVISPSSVTIAPGASLTTSASSQTNVGALGSVSLTGGAINSDRVNLQFGGQLSGSGSVNARVLAGTGSTITASGPLTLGDASSVAGFYANGDVNIQSGATTLLDANDAVFDSGANVTLGNGAGGSANLIANNGLTLDFGGNVSGFGTIGSPNNSATPVINNGNITGNSLAEPITLTGFVKGVGTCDNCNITGTDSPGFSPATVNRGSVSYNGTLEIELGGTDTGEFDRLEHILGAGIADLGGTLDVSLLGGFTPEAGDTFEIITATSVQDLFDVENFPTLAGLEWNVLYGANNVVLEVLAALAADTEPDGDVDGADFLALQRTSPSLIPSWQTEYGSTPSLASSQAVPEPASWLLFLTSLALPQRLRR